MQDKDLLRAIAAVSNRSYISIDNIKTDLDMLELQDKLAIMEKKGLIETLSGSGVGIYSIILTPEGREELRSSSHLETKGITGQELRTPDVGLLNTNQEFIFICYAREDEQSANKLASDLSPVLEIENIKVWIDKDALLGGEKWRISIPSTIKNSLAFLLIMSKESVDKRGYVQKELRYALDKLDELPESDIFIIPVRLEECEPSHPRINDLHWIDMFPNWEKGISKIIASIEAQYRKMFPEISSSNLPSLSISRSSREIPPESIESPLDKQDMVVLKIIGDCLIENGLGLFSQKVLQEAEQLGIDKKGALESIEILDDLSLLNINRLSRDVFHIKGFSLSGFDEYASNFLADYSSLKKLVANHIISNSEADSDSISGALSIDVFVVNNILKLLEASGRIKLIDFTHQGRRQRIYKIKYVSPLLRRDYGEK